MEEFSCPSECEEVEGKEIESTQDTTKFSCAAKLNVVWSGSARKTPLIQFQANAILGLDGPVDHPYTGPHRLTFKIAGNEYRLVRTLLFSHSFSEVSCSSSRFNIYWSGTHVHLSEVRGLLPHQRINHFPRSYMITRKDRLYQNISRMQQSKGMKHFNIIPTTFVLPDELSQFQAVFRKHRGVWITKPVSSSRGRGISLINHPKQVNKDESMVVSHYIDNPLCVNGLKFDLRIYVAVTSFNPLKIYLYEEGLARFATEPYSGAVQLNNLCMHLTNYSVNKKSAQYVRCETPGRDDYGSKWSMSALLRYLHKEGRDVAELMMKVEDVVIKAIIAGESHISSACEVFQTHKGNCFELYGFDILIDESLRPWLLEVNLSPSLGCDAPLDLRLKSNLVADLLTLVGVPLCNPYTRETPKPPKTHHPSRTPKPSSTLRLSSEEVMMLRDCREEYTRRGGFVRIFPSHDSWDLYSSFLESKGRRNYILHSELYPGKIKASHSPCPLTTIIAKRRSVTDTEPPSVCDSADGMLPLERVAVYLRRLENGPKIKPMWDSVQELLWHRASLTSSDGRFEVTTMAETTPLAPPTSSVSDPLQCLTVNITKLSKVQARKLFAAYLECVQKRLIKEASAMDDKSSHPITDTANFEVVVSFLKRAAQNLSSSFTLVEPNTQLPMKDRKEKLSHQLAEFILLYNKETIELDATSTETSGVPAKVIDMALIKASEKDLEKLLAAYARHSHSSAVLFGATVQVPTQAVKSGSESLRPATNWPLTSAEKQKLTASISSSSSIKSGKHVSRHAMSRVLQRQSRLPKTLSAVRQEPPNSTTDTDRTTQAVAVDTPPPYNFTKYSDEMLERSSLSPSDKRSLRVLTESLAAGRRLSDREKVGSGSSADGLPPRGPGRAMRGSARGERQQGNGGTKNKRLLRRSLSTQSLQSTSSDASVQSLKSAHSIQPQFKLVNERRLPPASLASKMKDYVSPYAQSVRKKSATVQRKSTTASIPKVKQREPHSLPGSSHGPTNPSDSEESVTEALHKLTMKQINRLHTRSPAMSRTLHSKETHNKTTHTGNCIQ